MAWYQQPLTPVDPDALLLEKYLKSPLDHPVVAAMRAEAEFRSVSATSSAASSSNSLYTTAPAHIGGGFFQQVNSAMRRGENAMTADQYVSAAGRNNGRQGVFDLDSYNRLKDSYVNRRVQAKSISSQAGAYGNSEHFQQQQQQQPTKQSAGRISDEAARLVKFYSDNRDRDAAREELNLRSFAPVSSSPPRREEHDDGVGMNSSVNVSPDWIRHRMVLHTATNLFQEQSVASGGGHHGGSGSGATSPRSWQDDVMRSITTQFNTATTTTSATAKASLPVATPTPSISPLPSLVVPTRQQDRVIPPPPATSQPHLPQQPEVDAFAAVDDAAADVSDVLRSYDDGHDDGFDDALDCTELSSAPSRSPIRFEAGAQYRSAVVPYPPSHPSSTGTLSAAATQQTNAANIHLNESRAPSSVATSVANSNPMQLSTQHSDPTNILISDLIKDRELAQGFDSLHARIDIVRSIMARKAIIHVEESSRELLARKAVSFFVHMFLFLDESLSRTSLLERERLVRTQIVESSRAVARREGVRSKLFEDWTNTEIVERRRLVHQRDLFIASLESPWLQLRRIWAPQHKLVVDEAAMRADIHRHFSTQFVSIAMGCVERSEELHRRQLLIVRDPMLSLRGIFSAQFHFAVGLRPEGAEDDGYFLPNDDATGTYDQVAVEEDQHFTTLSPVDLLCLRGASSDDIAAAHVHFSHCPRVIEERVTVLPESSLTKHTAAAPMPDDSSTPLEWSSFFLQSSNAAHMRSNNNASMSSTATSRLSQSKRQTPLMSMKKQPSTACSVSIAVPAYVWLSWLGDHLLDYFQRQREQAPHRWSALKLRRLMQRFVAGHFSMELTLVDYFALWRPALRLLLKEGEGRIRIEHEALLGFAATSTSDAHASQHLQPLSVIGELLDWHHRAVYQTRVSNAMQSILRGYLEVAQFECKLESIIRGGLFGYFAAWKGRLVFIRNIAEAEDESWESALVTAQRNALNAAISPVPSSEMSSTMATFTPSVISAANAPPAALAQQRYVPSSDGGDSRSSSTNIQRGTVTQHNSFGALPKRPLEALASMASPFYKPLSSAPSPQPQPQPYQFVAVPAVDHRMASPPLPHTFTHSPAKPPPPPLQHGGGQDSIGFELYQLADVTTSGWVRLANVAAALRLKKICFDLPRIARCFQRAARVYEETTGLRNEGSSGALAGRTSSTFLGGNDGPQYGTSSMLNREGFNLMVQILLNDLRSTKELPQQIEERWQYEQKYHVSPHRY
jgi:hypothetical protein